jgi:hypothetical protein
LALKRPSVLALGVEIASAPLGERLERAPVARPFDEHDRVRLRAGENLLSVHGRIFTAHRCPPAGRSIARARRHRLAAVVVEREGRK